MSGTYHTGYRRKRMEKRQARRLDGHQRRVLEDITTAAANAAAARWRLEPSAALPQMEATHG
jgi:hypothetical protein